MDGADAINDALAALSRRLNHLAARQVAAEAAIVLSPVLLQVVPDHALKLIAEMRTVRVSLPGGGDNAPLVMLTEEYVQRLADQLEQKVRTTIYASR
jgi:hypothetical protein